MSFSDNDIDLVWNKGRIVPGYDEKVVRKDCCGAWIVRNKYGDRTDDFGWEIDHVYPQSLGGDDNLDNLRPMQWQNNEAKQDDYPTYNSVVKADGIYNIEYSIKHTVNASLQEKLSVLYQK